MKIYEIFTMYAYYFNAYHFNTCCSNVSVIFQDLKCNYNFSFSFDMFLT